MNDTLQINPTVVKALMHLRGISYIHLAEMLQEPRRAVLSWLDGGASELSYETQLEALQFLGVRGEGPRQDKVHYWRISETTTARGVSQFWSLSVMAHAFGPATVTYIAREREAALAIRAITHFALQFPGFSVLLEVTSPAYLPCGFDPRQIDGLTWAQGHNAVVLRNEQYLALEPGSIRTAGLGRMLSMSKESATWDQLKDTALSSGLDLSALIRALEANRAGSALLESAPAAEATAPAVPSPSPNATHFNVGDARTHGGTPGGRASDVTAVDAHRLFVTPVRPAAPAARKESAGGLR